MAQQTINLGISPNDGLGDPLRTMGTKVNANFSELYGQAGAESPATKARKFLLTATRGGLFSPIWPKPPIALGTPGANSTVITDIGTEVQIPYNDPEITHYSGKRAGAELQWVTSPAYPSMPGAAIRFGTDAEAIEIRIPSIRYGAINGLIDGQWMDYWDAGMWGPEFTGNDNTFFKIDFGVGNGKPRVIDIFFGSSLRQFGGINVGPSAGIIGASNPYRIWKVPVNEPSVMFVGDSWAHGAGAEVMRGSFPYKVGEYLGIRSPIVSAVPGQGYLAREGGVGNTFRDRVADVEAFGDLDLLVIGPTGLNDGWETPANIQTEVTLFANQVIARQPKALIAVFGPQRSPVVSVSQAQADAIKNGWLSATGWNTSRMRFIDTFAPKNWFDTSETTGNFTASIYAASEGDKNHVNSKGHLYVARRVADAVLTWMSELTA